MFKSTASLPRLPRLSTLCSGATVCPGPPGPAVPPAQALGPHPSLSVVPQGAQAARGLAPADGQTDPVGNMSPVPDLRDFSNFSGLGRRTDGTQTTPPFLTSSKCSAYKMPPPLAVLAGKHPLYAGLWAGAVPSWLPAHLLVGSLERGPPRWPPQTGTLGHREAQAPTQGHTARERSASASVQPQVDGPLVISMVQIGD